MPSSLNLPEQRITVGCKGFYQRRVTLVDKSGKKTAVSTALILQYQHGAVDNNKLSWYSEPLKSVNVNGETLVGTFRSVDCHETVLADSNTLTCRECAGIPKCLSFRKRLHRAHARCVDSPSAGPTAPSHTKTRNEYLSREELLAKSASQAVQIANLRQEMWYLSSKEAKWHNRARTVDEKLKEYTNRKNKHAVSYAMREAEVTGAIEQTGFLTKFLKNVAQNSIREAEGRMTGKRYDEAVQLLYEVLLIMGGPRIAEFVRVNFFGPSLTSMYLWRQKKLHHILGKGTIDDLMRIAHLMKPLVETHKKCPWMLAEDETAIVRMVTYDQRTDRLLGFCGPGQNHDHCDPYFIVEIGDGEDGYLNVEAAFQNNRVGCYARAIILNPLNRNYPRIPIVVHPTCNRFNSEFVDNQQREIAALYKQVLEPVIGPCVGNASDGDSRRRKIMLQHARSRADAFQPIPREDGFTLTCTKVDTADLPGYKIESLSDQDNIHNTKKLANV